MCSQSGSRPRKGPADAGSHGCPGVTSSQPPDPCILIPDPSESGPSPWILRAARGTNHTGNRHEAGRTLAWGRPGCHRTRPGDSRQPAGRGKAAAALAWRPGCQGVINGVGEEKANKVSLILMQLHFFFFWPTIVRELKPRSFFLGRHLKRRDPISSQWRDVMGRSSERGIGKGRGGPGTHHTCPFLPPPHSLYSTPSPLASLFIECPMFPRHYNSERLSPLFLKLPPSFWQEAFCSRAGGLMAHWVKVK